MKKPVVKRLEYRLHPVRKNGQRSGDGVVRMLKRHAVVAALACSAALGGGQHATAVGQTMPDAKQKDIRVYTLDCGRLDFPDLAALADTGEYAGKHGNMAVPCFLIRHGKQWMLWDAGLGDDIAKVPGGENRYGFHWSVTKTLHEQLKQLGLAPANINYVGLSHVHADHVGNVGSFPGATFLVGPSDMAWGLSLPTPPTADRKLVKLLSNFKVRPVPFDLDVFGDGSVVMLRMPGHSPGHHCLMVKLPRTGVLLFSGDLFHTAEAYSSSLVPVINDSRADTLASMQRFKKIAIAEKARVIIQHSPEEFSSLPRFPEFLD